MHAIRRMFERHIQTEDVERILVNGSVIEDYPDDQPYPSRLVLGFVGGRPVHVVAAHSPAARETIIITVYEPDPKLWDATFRRRKRP
jgi:hypothetical protein